MLPAAGAAGAVLLFAPAEDERRPIRGGSPAGLARAAAVQAGRPPRARRDAPRPAAPDRISIPAAGIEAPVEAVAAERGALRVPEVGHAGWYAGGPRPGEAGRAVIIGHLDSRHGPGLFAAVPRLPPGTTVSLTDRTGSVHRYNVVGAVQLDKERFPAEHVYGGAATRVLVLVTCGGPFVAGRGYRDNVLVYARAV